MFGTKKNQKSKGAPGRPGEAGIGIKDWKQVGTGLVITLTNDSQIDIKDIRGPEGKKGPPGEAGEPGKAATLAKNGTNGTNGEKGDKGEDGTDGKDGAPGKNGTNGTNGTNGKNAIDGINGKNGANGKNGTNGDQGPQGGTGEKGDKGEDAAFSKWVELREIDSFSNAEEPVKVIFSHKIETGGAIGVSVTLMGRGSNRVSYFYGQKHCLLYKLDSAPFKVMKIENDIPNYICRKSDHKLSFDIQATKEGFDIVVIGSAVEEMIWKGEVRIATT